MPTWECSPCNFKTERQTHFLQHCQTQKHKTLQFLCETDPHLELGRTDLSQTSTLTDVTEDSISESDHRHELNFPVITSQTSPVHVNLNELNAPDEHIEDSEDIGHEPSCPTDQTDWFPFNSKTECLLYIFMNSTTHPISDEVVKYVLYMMKELGVPDIPSLQLLKEKKFGDYCWENMITKGVSEKNIPVWIVKPSEVLKLSVANPQISKKLIRQPGNEDIIRHPADAEKWKNEILFQTNTELVPEVTVPVKLFMDDTSAHKSKKWMALHCIQMQLSGLPLSDMQKQGSVQFVGASEKAGINDIASIVNDNMTELQQNGIKAYDASKNQICIIKSCVDTIIADYAMLSYCCNHLGSGANKYCPRCNADSDHYMSLGIKRTPAETQQQLRRLEIRSNEADKKKLRKKKGIKEHPNVIWNMLDPHRDIPVGMLHLVPLGLAKHLVKYIIKIADEATVRKMSCHLQSTYPQSRFYNFFKYIDSRQGKDFKEYMQIAPFNMIYAGIPRCFVKMTACLASIQKQLNKTSFGEDDIAQIRESIRQYHQLIHEHTPELKKKAKTHLLLHMVEDIQRHGPPKAYAEDAFEKNHGCIRNMIFLQNQKARSRDSCISFAKQYLCQHIMHGGYFETGTVWSQATPAVMRTGTSSIVQKFLGMDQSKRSKKKNPGTISLVQRKKNKKPALETESEDVLLQALLCLNITDHNFARYSLLRGSAVLDKEHVLVHEGEWMTYLNANKQECIGVFKEGLIVIPKRGQQKQIMVVYKSALVNEKVYGCQKVQKLQQKDILESKHILRKLNVVHDCSAEGCRLVETRRIERVEQEDITTERLHLKHTYAHNTFVVNNFAI